MHYSQYTRTLQTTDLLGFDYTKAPHTLARADKQEEKRFIEITLPDLKEQLDQGKPNHF